MTLKQSQRDSIKQISDMIAQFRLQADSTFGGKTWAEVSWAGLADCLIKHGQALIELGDRLKSGAPPQWLADQRAGYAASAIGQLMRKKEQDNE